MSRIPEFATLVAIAFSITTPAFSGEFDGAYVGVSAAAGFNAPITPDFEFGAFAGYNAELGNGMIAGGEIELGHNPKSLWGLNATTGTLDGRAGYLIMGDVLAYGRAGLGYTTGAGGSMVWDVGAGVEVPVMEDVRLRGEFERVDPFETGMMTQYNGKVGVAYSF